VTKWHQADRVLIAPSILSANFSKLAAEIQEVEQAGCDLIHVDVMDGHFVPNLTIGPVVVSAVRQSTKLPLDVHLMIDDPGQYVEEFRKAGADWLTIHVEIKGDVAGTLKKIRQLGAKPGISLRPKTNLSALKPYLSLVDLVLVMTVEPGFGGQAFMPDMLAKVKELKKGYKGHISVDGGIAAATIRQARKAGANLFVAGSAIFGATDRKKQIDELRRLAG